MPPHELRERMVVIIEENAGNEVCIRQRHASEARATAAGCLYQRYR